MKKKTFVSSLLTACLILTVQGFLPVHAEDAAQDTVSAEVTIEPSTATWPQGPEIASEAAIIIEQSTGQVLYEKNADEIYYPSSAVKIMTSLLALENSALTDEVTMTPTGVSGVTDGGVSIASQVDEIFTMEQCLYAIMLASANDISLQVAEHVGGSVENFVAMMNQKAAELGCTNTVFTNPTGLPDPNQHTTARDLALIMKAAMANPSFQTIASTLSYTIPATNLSGGARALTNKFTMIDPASDAYYAGCLGGKEGYTSASGSVLATQAMRSDMTLTCVVMMGAADHTDDEAIALLDFAFSHFQFMDLGSDDFNVISGGTVLVPAGISPDSIQIQDSDAGDGTLVRNYYYGDHLVGTATAKEPEVQDTTKAEESKRHLQEAEDYSNHVSWIPYILIGLSGIILFSFLFIKLRKTLKK